MHLKTLTKICTFLQVNIMCKKKENNHKYSYQIITKALKWPEKVHSYLNKLQKEPQMRNKLIVEQTKFHVADPQETSDHTCRAVLS